MQKLYLVACSLTNDTKQLQQLNKVSISDINLHQVMQKLYTFSSNSNVLIVWLHSTYVSFWRLQNTYYN